MSGITTVGAFTGPGRHLSARVCWGGLFVARIWYTLWNARSGDTSLFDQTFVLHMKKLRYSLGMMLMG